MPRRQGRPLVAVALVERRLDDDGAALGAAGPLVLRQAQVQRDDHGAEAQAGVQRHGEGLARRQRQADAVPARAPRAASRRAPASAATRRSA